MNDVHAEWQKPSPSMATSTKAFEVRYLTHCSAQSVGDLEVSQTSSANTDRGRYESFFFTALKQHMHSWHALEQTPCENAAQRQAGARKRPCALFLPAISRPLFPRFFPFFARFHRLAEAVPTSRKPEPGAKKQLARASKQKDKPFLRPS